MLDKHIFLSFEMISSLLHLLQVNLISISLFVELWILFPLECELSIHCELCVIHNFVVFDIIFCSAFRWTCNDFREVSEFIFELNEMKTFLFSDALIRFLIEKSEEKGF